MILIFFGFIYNIGEGKRHENRIYWNWKHNRTGKQCLLSDR